MQYNFYCKQLLPAALIMLFLSCNDGTKENSRTPKKNESSTDTAATPVKDTGTAGTKAKKAPAINLFDTVSLKKLVLCMKDSASVMERIGMKLGAIYGEKLAKCIKDNKLTVAGAPMAWYKSQQAPYFFEAGLPVNKIPAKMPAGMYIKELPAGTVMIARYFGPYEMMGMAYEAAAERMKTGNSKAAGEPYEVYIGDPVTQPDPYKVQTDVVFPVKIPEKNQAP